MTGSLLALASSLTGGVSDFLGGMNSRAIGPVRWMFVTQLIGVVFAGVWVAISGAALPGSDAIAAAVGAGLGLMVCLLAFFQAMVVGTITIVAPISGTGVVIPIVVGLARGEHPTAAQVAGIIAACIGIVFASRAPGEDPAVRRGTGLWLALLAAIGGGVFLWLMDPASRGGVPWAALIARAVPMLVLGALLCARRGSPRLELPSGTLWCACLAAVLSGSSLGLYAFATLHGQLAIVSVLGSLYPAVTVLLAYRVLGERVHRIQRIGIAVVLVGVVFMSAS